MNDHDHDVTDLLAVDAAADAAFEHHCLDVVDELDDDAAPATFLLIVPKSDRSYVHRDAASKAAARAATAAASKNTRQLRRPALI